MRVWSASTGQEVQKTNAVGDITPLTFTLDGTALLTNKGHIRIDKFGWVEAPGKLHFAWFFCLFHPLYFCEVRLVR